MIIQLSSLGDLLEDYDDADPVMIHRAGLIMGLELKQAVHLGVSIVIYEPSVTTFVHTVEQLIAYCAAEYPNKVSVLCLVTIKMGFQMG
jgi:hypothetical protein